LKTCRMIGFVLYAWQAKICSRRCKIKVLGINGSPRLRGNCDILLDRALEGAVSAGAATEKIFLNKLTYRGCQECPDARTDGNCKIEDDMQRVFPKVFEADVIIVASPIFFGSVSSQTKAMIDRFQCYWMGRYFHHSVEQPMRKKGAFLSAQGNEKDEFFLNAKGVIKNFFATVNAEYSEELFCKKVDAKGDIQKRQDCLDAAYGIGERLGIENP